MSDGLPPHWIEIKLQDVGNWSTGGTPSRQRPEYFGKGTPWIKSGDLPDGPVVKTDEEITKIGLQNSTDKLYPIGTVSMALYGATIGKLGILTFPAATNQACANVIPNNNLVVTNYLFYYLFSQRDNFIQSGQGGDSQTLVKELFVIILFPLLLLPSNIASLPNSTGFLKK